LASSASARPSRDATPLWLKTLVIAMAVLIVAGFAVLAVGLVQRLSSANAPRPPAAGTAFAERIALPSGAKVRSISPIGDRLVVHIETADGLSSAYIVDPRNGALLGTIDFPPGAAR